MKLYRLSKVNSDMSLATASKLNNISPKSNSSTDPQQRVTIENNRKNYLDPNNSSQLSSTSRVLTDSQELVSFKPHQYPKYTSTSDNNVMSFGGNQGLLQSNIGKDSINESTLIKQYDETRDTKNGDQEFIYFDRQNSIDDD